MAYMINLKSCCGCRQCEIACLTSCIEVKLQIKGNLTLYPFINEKDCISCGSCVDACPLGAIQVRQ